MTGPVEHQIRLAKEERLDHGDWWRSRCICGKYTSGLHWSPGRAEATGNEHAKAKNGAAS